MCVRITDQESFCAEDVFFAALEVERADHFTLHAVIVGQFAKDNVDYRKRLKGFCDAMVQK